MAVVPLKPFLAVTVTGARPSLPLAAVPERASGEGTSAAP